MPGPQDVPENATNPSDSPGPPGILCFSTVDWDYLWHRPQMIMSRFAQDGHPIVYVDTLGLRSPHLGDLSRIISRARNRMAAPSGGLRRTAQGVHVTSPLLLPFLNSRLARRANLLRLVPTLQQQLAQVGAQDPIIWVYLPTWTVLQCVDRIPHRLLVYESIDALSSNPAGVSRDYAASERTILRRADLVLATSEALLQDKAPHNSNAHWVPSGVGAEFFDQVDPAAKIEGLSRPRIGFFGALDHRLDLETMTALARAHRAWSFVLIGPARRDISGLAAEANVHCLGSMAHAELPRYLQALDVLYLPYIVDDFTRSIYPAKIFECLALGKPVVATRLPALEEFGGLVQLAADVDQFDAALRNAVAEDRPDLRARRVELARANSWEARYREIRGYVEEAQGRSVSSPS